MFSQLNSSFAAHAKWGLSAVGRRASARSSYYPHVKRLFDIVGAFSILIILCPLLIIICILLSSQSGPVIFRHKRIGQGGRSFDCLKFRTMVVDGDAVLTRHFELNPEARAEWETTHKLKNDPRVTAIGRMLRKSSIDELPQLVNVLLGDMSLVGPRPIVRDEIPFYGPRIVHYEKMRPGLTGQWQVGGRSDLSYESRVALDCDYVARCSLTRDLLILILTIPAVLKSHGSY